MLHCMGILSPYLLSQPPEGDQGLCSVDPQRVGKAPIEAILESKRCSYEGDYQSMIEPTLKASSAECAHKRQHDLS